MTPRTDQGDRPLLEVRSLVKHFPLGGFLFSRRGIIRAVDDVSFTIGASETLTLVGESGCGKTTTARLILLLERPTSGDVFFDGHRINDLDGKDMKRYRSMVQAVFQDPWSSLDPRMRIGEFIAEPLEIHARLSRKEIARRVSDLLTEVGLDEAMARNYPHEFSGGQRQRISVARALALRPRLIVLDEPVSALDVSVRAQIMNLLRDLQLRYGISYLLIAHNLATVRYLSHRVAVMYLGQIVEEADSEKIFQSPLHPYTKALMAAAERVGPGDDDSLVLDAEVPSAAAPPPGCRFHTRCPLAFGRCRLEMPVLREVSSEHPVACHLYPADDQTQHDRRIPVAGGSQWIAPEVASAVQAPASGAPGQ